MPEDKSRQEFSSDEVATGLINHDAAVLEYLYASNYPFVESWILKNNGSRDDAKDVFQDALVAVWMNVKNGKYHSNGVAFGTYLKQVARNKWIDRLRSKEFKSTGRVYDENALHDQADHDREAQEQEERFQYLEGLYQNLGQKCKQILKGFYFDKKSLAELGDDLGHDEQSMRTMKYRCMQKLKEMHRKNERSRQRL